MNAELSPREQAKVDLAAALQAACKELRWSPTRLGAEAEATASSAAQWLSGAATPGGEILMLLMQRNMVVREHLLRAAA